MQSYLYFGNKVPDNFLGCTVCSWQSMQLLPISTLVMWYLILLGHVAALCLMSSFADTQHSLCCHWWQHASSNTVIRASFVLFVLPTWLTPMNFTVKRVVQHFLRFFLWCVNSKSRPSNLYCTLIAPSVLIFSSGNTVLISLSAYPSTLQLSPYSPARSSWLVRPWRPRENELCFNLASLCRHHAGSDFFLLSSFHIFYYFRA